MKQLYILLPVILVLNFANAQDEDIINKIKKEKLLTEKQLEYFNEYLGKVEEKNNSIYVTAIFQAKFKDRLGHFYSTFIETYLDDSGHTETEQYEATKNLLIEIEKLKSIKLISTKLYDKYKARIAAKEFFWDLIFYKELTESALYDAWIAPEVLEPYAQKLIGLKIVTAKKDAMLSDIKAGKFEGPLDFLKYYDKAVVIDAKDYGSKPEEFVDAVHRKMASILPELAYESLSYKIITEKKYGTDFNNIITNIKTKRGEYSLKSYYSGGFSENDVQTINCQEYYRIFNKILTDAKSSYRLTFINLLTYPTMQFGFAALTKEQIDALQEVGGYTIPWSENFDQPTTAEIKSTIEICKNAGLFKHLDTKQIAKAQDDIRAELINAPIDVLLYFSDVAWSFDMEMGNLDAPYAELVKEYAKLTHGELKPEKITDNFATQGQQATLRFIVKKQVFEKQFKIENDWVDTDIFSFMNEVARKTALKGSFYEIGDGGQGVHVLYLTPQQYATLKSNNIIPAE